MTGASLHGGAVPHGTIESPQREDVTVRLATVLRVLARTTAESFALNRCSIFLRQGDVLVPFMSHREPRASLSATRVTRASAARRSASFIPTVVPAIGVASTNAFGAQLAALAVELFEPFVFSVAVQ